MDDVLAGMAAGGMSAFKFSRHIFSQEEVSKEIASETKSGIVVYTYGLSPFSTEAVSILEQTGYSFETIELGAEWFLLNGKDSVKRVLLSEFVENGATSLPKVFVGGKCSDSPG